MARGDPAAFPFAARASLRKFSFEQESGAPGGLAVIHFVISLACGPQVTGPPASARCHPHSAGTA